MVGKLEDGMLLLQKESLCAIKKRLLLSVLSGQVDLKIEFCLEVENAFESSRMAVRSISSSGVVS